MSSVLLKLGMHVSPSTVVTQLISPKTSTNHESGAINWPGCQRPELQLTLIEGNKVECYQSFQTLTT